MTRWAPVKDLVEFIARSLVSKPEAVVVEETERDGNPVISLQVEQEDLGMIIGRRGRTATAIRTLVTAAAQRDGRDIQVEIQD